MNVEVQKLSPGIHGDYVSLLHDKLQRFGYIIDDYEVREKFFGESTRVAVSKFQSENDLDMTGKVDEATIYKLYELSKQKDDHLKVSGEIVTNVGTIAKGVRVIAVDKSTGKDNVLGKATTDDSGKYIIRYKEKDLKKTGKKNADIEIRVADPEDESKIYGISSVHFNASDNERINLVLPRESMVKIPEFTKIISDLKPHITNGSLKDLQENEKRQDISYLANKTGWDARLVAMISVADKYSNETDIPPEFYHTLFRAGIPTDTYGLYRTNLETVKLIWEKAVEEKIIDASLKPKIKRNLAKFKEISTTYLLEAVEPVVGVSSLRDLLRISLPSAKKQREFVELYFNHAQDMTKFWTAVEAKFGKVTAERLQLDSKLGYLTMTNTELIQKLRSSNIVQESPADLIKKGFYKKEAWDTLLSNGVPIPKEVSGKTSQEKKRNYIDYMVFLLKISYPTLVVAEMVNKDEIKVSGGHKVKKELYEFLQNTYDKFQIGVQSLDKIIEDNDIELEKQVLVELKKIQRIYQISPSDDAMKALWENKFDSALAVVQYDERDFVAKFGKALGGEDIAEMVYGKAHQVHSIILNTTISYLTYRTNSKVYAISGSGNGAQGLAAAAGAAAASSSSAELIAYPTMEGLFGSMDYCSCEHCRSALSPAAYLVDLLQFINLKKYNLNGEELLPRTYKKDNPLDVLLEMRPDIEHIELTCENTNTVLPYIDLVNEILEYYVVNNHTLSGFKGYNVQDDITSAELLANPQFVNEQAYTLLKDQVYPFNLPFNQPLEALRLFYDHVGIKLHDAMEKLRVNDNLDSPSGTGQKPLYTWREVYNEFLGISQEEYEVLTESVTKSLPLYFGEGQAMAFEDFIENSKLFNAKVFSRKADTTYDELIEIVKTEFINPDNYLIPKIQKLSIKADQEALDNYRKISFADVKKFKSENISSANFEKMIPPPSELDRSIYGGDIRKWLLEDNYDKIMNLIVLSTPSEAAAAADCGFDKSELRYASPDSAQNELKEMDYWRLLRFIRLWKKLGWTIEDTDKAIVALYKSQFRPISTDNINTQKQKLDDGFKDLLVKLRHVKAIKEKLVLNQKDSLVKLLVLWSNIDTHGSNSLYKQMFLHSSISKIDKAFEDNGYGEYLKDTSQHIVDHLAPIQAAFNLTAQELSLILENASLNSNNNPSLSLENISKIYRYSFLARSLKLSIHELIALKKMSGIDPFHELEDVHPSTLRFIELAQLIKQSNFKITTLSYFLQHEDLTGKASPSKDNILSFARTIREGLLMIEHEHKVVDDDPTGEIVKSKMALVYENAVVDKFFGLLQGTTSYSINYSQSQDKLAKGLLAISDRISYDHLQKQLTYHGVITESIKNKFKAAASATNAFKNAIQKLYDMGQDDFRDLFDKYSNLKSLYESYTSSRKPDEKEKMRDILQDFLPSLKRELKHLFIKQTINSSVNVDLTILNGLLENKNIMHSIGDNSNNNDIEASILDFLKLETNGVSVRYFFANSTAGTSNMELSGIPFNRGIFAKSELANSNLVQRLLNAKILREVANYSNYVYFSDSIKDDGQLKARLEELNNIISSSKMKQVLDIWKKTDNKLPANLANTNGKISATWRFYLEVPANSNYNFYLEADTTANVKISIDQKEIEIKDDQNKGIWQNKEAIELKAGRLYSIQLEVAKVKNKAILKWESKATGKENIPLKYLCPYGEIGNFSHAYIKLLKAVGLVEMLQLKEREMLFFSTNASFQIDGKSFLDTIIVTPDPNKDKVTALFSKIFDLLRYAELKRSLSVTDESLVMILNDPNVKDPNGESMLMKASRWDESFLDELLKRFGWTQTDLSDLNKLLRMHEAMEVVKKFGVSAALLLKWTTNQPLADTVHDVMHYLRAKYDESVWLNALQPISDQLRRRRRDALVSYVLHNMQKNEKTKHIDTADKLFEYFLIDVEMDPCTKTSRIRQAISSVQLFIQRCLMNLEAEVSPSSIKSDQWSWMKRYRVWEANRKIFLYPENWLEPELRDEKSPFFRDLESELLQADTTDELAEVALLNYLEKLDDVSKLEICGMHLQENDKGNQFDDILHVFGRTIGASRKYYYRRFEYGYWTPWEKVDLDIEDNPILPVVWKNRLFLFWLSVVRKGSSGNLKGTDSNKTSPSELTTDELNTAARESIEINLLWSEYYNNKWQPKKTSDFNNPIKYEGLQPDEFKREDTVISPFFDDSALLINVLHSPKYYNFKLFNKHSNPLIQPEARSAYSSLGSRIFQDSDKGLRIKYSSRSDLRRFEHDIMERLDYHDDNHDDSHGIVANDALVTNPFEAPFFYQDRKYVFFVKPEESIITIPEHQLVGGYVPGPKVSDDPLFPDVWIKPKIDLETQPEVDFKDIFGPHGPQVHEELPWVTDITTGTDGSIINPNPIDFTDESISTDKVVLDNRIVTFDGVKIGPLGSSYARLIYNKKLGNDNFETTNTWRRM